MTTVITEECINCAACEPECPQDAISEGQDIFLIDAELCCECVGFHTELACAAVCPVDCCAIDSAHTETKEQLLAKAQRVHPETDFGDKPPSHIA